MTVRTGRPRGWSSRASLLRSAGGFLCIAALLSLSACTDATPAPADPGRMGPFAVGFTSHRLVDASRAGDGGAFVYRPVPVLVWYPVDPGRIGPRTAGASYPLDPFYDQLPTSPSSLWERQGVDPAYEEPPPSSRGPFPLVVLSHGYGSPAYFSGLATRMASHGFVFAVVNHLGEPSVFPWYPPPRNAARNMYDRPRDVAFGLDDLLARNATPSDLLFGIVDPGRVAAAGFSMGGFTAIALAAGDEDACVIPDVPLAEALRPLDASGPHCVPFAPDPRFRALALLDAANQALFVREIERVQVPVLGMGESWDSLARVNPDAASWQARQHALVSGRPAYRVDVADTNHMGSFGEACPMLAVLKVLAPALDADGSLTAQERAFCEGFTPWPDVRDVTGKYLVSFLKTELAGAPGYASILTPGWAAAHEPLVQFFTHERLPASSVTDEWPPDDTYYRYQSEVP